MQSQVTFACFLERDVLFAATHLDPDMINLIVLYIGFPEEIKTRKRKLVEQVAHVTKEISRFIDGYPRTKEDYKQMCNLDAIPHSDYNRYTCGCWCILHLEFYDAIQHGKRRKYTHTLCGS
jgi:hypothetical protein